MKRLARPFWVILALLFLFEAWLWDRLAPIVGRLVTVIPWGRIKPALVRLVDRLSPQATLVVFVVPFILLLPLKFYEFFLWARQWAHDKIMPITQRLREWSRQTVDPVAQRLRRWRRLLQPRHAGRLLHRLMRIRRRMRAAAP